MSFVKCLKCVICSAEQSIVDAYFPEDLFDSITKYKIDQLFWICRTCKTYYIQNSALAVSVLVDKLNNSEESIVNLNDKQEERTSSNKLQNNENHNKKEMPEIYVEKDDSFLSCSEDLPRCENTKEKKSYIKYVHRILNLIKIDPEEDKNSRNVVQSVLNTLLNALKKNEEFACMFNKFFYTGSSYNDLRITSANEFDIDLVVKVPKNVKLTPVLHKQCYFGKLKFEIMDDDSTSLPVKVLKDMSRDNYLLPRKISSWLQSQIDIILRQGLQPIPNVYEVKSVQSGPARTLIVKSDLEYDISIDLVPVFEFEYSVLDGSHIFHDLDNLKKDDKNRDIWFMVPKECKGEINGSFTDMSFYWRSDYPYAEKCILSGKECAKSVIRILKLFRDKKDWKGLASYHLKMVVILEVVRNPDSEFWKNSNVFHRLMDAFKQLKKYLKDRNLPHFLTKNNLLHKFNVDLCENWYNHLNRNIPLYETDPDNLLKQLECEEGTRFTSKEVGKDEENASSFCII